MRSEYIVRKTSMRGSLRFSVLRFWLLFRSVVAVFVPKNFAFADFPFFSIWFLVFCCFSFFKNINGFWIDTVSEVFLSLPYCCSGLSGNYAPLLISNSRETSICSSRHYCIGSIRFSITLMWKFIGFDSFACSFRFWLYFLWFFQTDEFFIDYFR